MVHRVTLYELKNGHECRIMLSVGFCFEANKVRLLTSKSTYFIEDPAGWFCELLTPTDCKQCR